MKTLLTLLALTIPSFAQAAPGCAFGESTGDLKYILKNQGRNKVWHQTEHLSLHKEQRLQGLDASEKELILLVMGAEEENATESLTDFSNADGYITYFTHNSNGRNFAIVASYPGDNEHGLIIEIKNARDGSVQVIDVSAVISDGDLEDCKVQ